MTFGEFYRDEYLPRHADPACQWLHLLGVPVTVAYAAVVAWLGRWGWLVLLPVPAYALGWLGHLLAHNRPTFFEHPVWSFFGYWRMIGSIVAGKTPA